MEKGATFPLLSIAPTASTPGSAAGYPIWAALKSLPDDATITASEWIALLTELVRSCDGPLPEEMFIILAPRAVARLIPAAIFAVTPGPLETFIGISLASGAIPRMPSLEL